jgi:hypothetical protein
MFATECAEWFRPTHPWAGAVGRVYYLALLGWVALAIFVLAKNSLNFSARSALVSGFTTALASLVGLAVGDLLRAAVIGAGWGVGLSSLREIALFAAVVVVFSAVAALVVLAVGFVVRFAPGAALGLGKLGRGVNRVVPTWLLASTVLLAVAAVCLHAFARDIVQMTAVEVGSWMVSLWGYFMLVMLILGLRGFVRLRRVRHRTPDQYPGVSPEALAAWNKADRAANLTMVLLATATFCVPAIDASLRPPGALLPNPGVRAAEAIALPVLLVSFVVLTSILSLRAARLRAVTGVRKGS